MNRWLLVVACLLLPSPAAAQQQRSQLPPLNATTVSARQLTNAGAGNAVWILNDGTTEVFVRLGDGTVVATPNDIPILPGCGVPFDLGVANNIAAITLAGSSTVRITQGASVQPAVCAGRTAGGFPNNDGSMTTTTGGLAQNLFGGATPRNGYHIANPGISVCWFSQFQVAAPNGLGSEQVVPGGGYESPLGVSPSHSVSVYCPLTGDPVTAWQW
jgi:hypothetical protein